MNELPKETKFWLRVGLFSAAGVVVLFLSIYGGLLYLRHQALIELQETGNAIMKLNEGYTVGGLPGNCGLPPGNDPTETPPISTYPKYVKSPNEEPPVD